MNGRRLTAVEIDEKRSQGLCFFCDEKYVVGHNCSAKWQIFMVEVVEEEAIQEVVMEEET